MIDPNGSPNAHIEQHIQDLEREIDRYRKILEWQGPDPVAKLGWPVEAGFLVFDSISEAAKAAEKQGKSRKRDLKTRL
jgi:hypothetical protein